MPTRGSAISGVESVGSPMFEKRGATGIPGIEAARGASAWCVAPRQGFVHGLGRCG